MAASTTAGEALLAAIHADPSSDAARQVYGDWLSEQGDPRGKFIALQFARKAGTLDEAGAKEERRLALKHWKAWAGPLAPHLLRGETRFERGFLSRCSVLALTGPKCAALVGRPEWSTVEHLDVSTQYGPKADVVSLVTHPATRALRTVRGIGAAQMARLASRDGELGLQAIAVEWQPDAAGVTEQIAEARALPHLRHLGVCADFLGRAHLPTEELRWLFASRLVARLESIRLAHVGPVPAVLDALQRVERVQEIEFVQLWEVCLHAEPNGHRARFTRGPDGRFSKLDAGWPRMDELRAGDVRDLVEVLDSLAPDVLSSLRITLPARTSTSKELERAMERFTRLDVRELRCAGPQPPVTLVDP